jgi:hypothetical protein
VWRVVEEEDRSNKKRKRDEEKKQHGKQLKGVSLLQFNPCKPTMVV